MDPPAIIAATKQPLPSCADNIARARELLAVPTPQHHNADADAVNPNNPPTASHLEGLRATPLGRYHRTTSVN